MSPQLGQGANLALVDAWVLADCLRTTPDDLGAALAAYTRRRAAHLRFYAWSSRLLTPMFQSRVGVLAVPRDRLAAPVGRIGVSCATRWSARWPARRPGSGPSSARRTCRADDHTGAGRFRGLRK